MATGNRAPRIVVGVDGSEASVEALRQAQRLAVPLGAEIEATGCWQYPQMYVGHEMMGIKGFEEGAGELLEETVVSAFGPDRPGNVRTCLLHGPARESLIDSSRDADLLVVGRRGQAASAVFCSVRSAQSASPTRIARCGSSTHRQKTAKANSAVRLKWTTCRAAPLRVDPPPDAAHPRVWAAAWLFPRVPPGMDPGQDFDAEDSAERDGQ